MYRRELEYNCNWSQFGLLHWGSYIRGNLCTRKYRQSRCDCTYYGIDCLKCQKISDEKVALKKIVQISTNFGVFSIYVILFSISAWILMNGSFFRTTAFNPKLFLSSDEIRDLQRVLAGHYTSFMYNFRGSAKVWL